VACAPQAYGGSAAVRTAVSVSAVAGTLVIGQFSFDGIDITVGIYITVGLACFAHLQITYRRFAVELTRLRKGLALVALVLVTTCGVQHPWSPT
jgi:hypothetical protein